MARHARRRGEDAREEVQKEVRLELTPMIDVTFLILVFFLCTLQFKTLEGKLESYLPTEKGMGTPEAAIDEPIEVVLMPADAGGAETPRFALGIKGRGEPLGHARVDEQSGQVTWSPADAIQALRATVALGVDIDPSRAGHIRADPEVPHDLVVLALDVLVEAGVHEVSYAGIPSDLVRRLQQR